jgi:hypothetical protein
MIEDRRVCMIRKCGSRVVHIGVIPREYAKSVGKPTACGQSGWRNAWVRVSEAELSKRSVLRKCRKCFPSEKARDGK